MSGTQFEALIRVLSEAKVEFVLIGGLAAVVHGSAYVTHDLDICYERSVDNVDRLCRALAGIHPALRGAPKNLPFRLDTATVSAGLNFTLDTDLGELDLLGEVQPFGGHAEVKSHSDEAELFGQLVRVLSLEALIRAKRSAGRRKDLLVIPELEALLELRKRPGG